MDQSLKKRKSKLRFLDRSVLVRLAVLFAALLCFVNRLASIHDGFLLPSHEKPHSCRCYKTT
jgi:hypothetical protein